MQAAGARTTVSGKVYAKSQPVPVRIKIAAALCASQRRQVTARGRVDNEVRHALLRFTEGSEYRPAFAEVC